MKNPVTRWLSLMWREHLARPGLMTLLGTLFLFLGACLMAVRGFWDWLVPVWVFSAAGMAFSSGVLLERYMPGSEAYHRGFIAGIEAWRGHEQDQETQ